jgi:uncharacterized repeat protein (TIGR01451 family)
MKYSATLWSRSASRVYVLLLGIALIAIVAICSRGVSAQSQNLSDISVLKSTDNETAIPGGQITYQIVVTNGGPDPADNVLLSDRLPSHTTFVSANPSANFDGTTVTINFGTIQPFESVSLILVLKVDSDTPPGTTITNTANATSSSADNDPSNNQATASTLVVAPTAELAVVKTGPDSADLGSSINYTIQVVNSGTLDAANVAFSDPLPDHTTFGAASASQGSTAFNGTTITANLGTVPVGTSAFVFVTVTINSDTPKGSLIVNTAVASTSTPEGNLEDNVSSALTAVSGVFPGDLIISEFRLRGPGVAIIGRPSGSGSRLKAALSGNAASNGALDEFVELYNNTDAPITINTLDDSSGFALAASDGIVRFVIPNGTTIPARGHFLGVNSVGYSLNGYPSSNSGGPGTTATGDATYTLDIADNAGIALFRTSIPENFSTGTRLDAVGSTAEANTLYKEGNGYPALTNPASVDYSFYRDNCGKGGSTSSTGPCTRFTPKDTDNNAADFIFVDTDGSDLGAGQRLGAPGPENLASPIQSNGSIESFLLDSTSSNTVAPNRVRNLTPDPLNNSTFGTLDIRRRFVNNSDQPVTRLRFRIIDISSLPDLSGADLRALTSTQLVVNGINDANTCGGPAPCSVTVRGLVLETPPSQPLGGAFNSSLSDGLVNLQTPLAPGDSINVRFLFGVQKTGSFRILFNIETLNEVQIPGRPLKPQTSKVKFK